MIWAQLCVDLCVALSACAAVMFVIVTSERMRAPTSEAEQKAHALLRAWLSPEQAQQYNSQRHFDVIGSDTGTRYRIRHGRMVNIDQLDSAGNKVCVWVRRSGRKLSGKRLYVGAEDRAGDVRNEGLGYCKPKTERGVESAVPPCDEQSRIVTRAVAPLKNISPPCR
jgi:hypothetical protein